MKPCRIELSKHDQLVGLDKSNQDLGELASPSYDYDSNSFTKPVLDIDLSYFESKELQLVTENPLRSDSNHSDASKQRTDLEKVIEEIFTNKSAVPLSPKLLTSNAILKKNDDFFSSDKKCDITSLF